MYIGHDGRYRTDSLFVERITKHHGKIKLSPVYTLSERQEKDGVKSLYDIFINSVDEYDFAIKAFGSKAHLDKLKEIKWFNESWRGFRGFRGYNAWLDDMSERDISLGKQVLMQRAREGDTSAARKLIDMNKPNNTKQGAGRPKKEDIKRESIRLAEEQHDVKEDLQRLNSANVIKLRG